MLVTADESAMCVVLVEPNIGCLRRDRGTPSRRVPNRGLDTTLKDIAEVGLAAQFLEMYVDITPLSVSEATSE